jgi:HlyD family secretion protein
MLVPNAALRFSPPVTEEAARNGGSLISRLFPRPPPASRSRESADAKGKRQRVYVLRDNQPSVVPVSTGSTDGVMTEITSGDIEVGTQVVTDMMSATP